MPTLAEQLVAFATDVGAQIKALLPRLLPTGGAIGQVVQKTAQGFGWVNLPAAGGGSEPWTRIKLAADATNPAAAFADLAGFTFTPPANTDFIIEAELLLVTTTPANLPRIGVALPAGMQWAAVEIRQAGATDITQVQQHGGTLATAANVQVPAGGLAVANSPRMCTVVVKGRSGAAPAAIKLQLAAETAAANVVFVKAGSEMRHRTL